MEHPKSKLKSNKLLKLGLIFLSSFTLYYTYNNINSKNIGTNIYRRNVNNIRSNNRMLKVFSKKEIKPDKIKINTLLGHVRYNDSSSVSCYLAKKNNKDVILKEYNGITKNLVNRQLFTEELVKKKKFKKEPIVYTDGIFETDNIINLNNVTIKMEDKSLWTIEDINILTNLLICYPYYEQKKNIISIFNNNYLDNRNNFIKKVIKESLIELQKMYQTNISLGNIDPGSIVLSTLNDVDYKNLKVYFTKLGNSININYNRDSILLDARSVYDYNSLVNIKNQIEIIKKKDLYNLGMIFFYLIFSSLSLEGPNERSAINFIERRILFCNKNFYKFREMSLQDEWKYILLLLDDNNMNGWKFFNKLYNSNSTIDNTINELINHSFLNIN